MYSPGLGKTHGLRKASRNRGFSTTINIPHNITQHVNAMMPVKAPSTVMSAKKPSATPEDEFKDYSGLLYKPLNYSPAPGMVCMAIKYFEAPEVYGAIATDLGLDKNGNVTSARNVLTKIVCKKASSNLRGLSTSLGNLPYVGGNQLPYVGGNQLSPGGDRSSPALSGGAQRISTRASACRAMGGTFQQYSTNPEIDPAGDCYIQLAPPAPPPPPAPAPLPPPAPIITVSPNIQTSVSPQISPVFQQAFQPTNSPMTAGTTQTSPTAQTATTPTPQPAPSYAPQPIPQPAPSYTPPPAFYAPPAQVAPVPSAIPPAYASGPLPAIAADNAPVYDTSGTAITPTPIAPVASGKLFSSPLLWGALAIGLGVVIFSQKGKK